MKTTTALCALLLSGCGYANIDDVKSVACQRWKEIGYNCVGYEGYQWGFWAVGSYGGAHVWHTLVRDSNPKTIYSGSVQKWGAEYHMYGPRAVDAISQ